MVAGPAAGVIHERVQRVRRLHDRLHPLHDRLVTYCPSRGALVTLDECLPCRHCRTLAIDPRDAGSYVVCDWSAL